MSLNRAKIRMKEIELFEAKTNLCKIAEMVKRTGQPVTLTKRGEPYVELVPHQGAPAHRRPQAQVLADLDELRQELPKSSHKQIEADIEDGRR
jgi:prevent-host-death family protein